MSGSSRQFVPSATTATAGETTQDALLGGRVSLLQPAKGYRANVDTVLLAAAITPGERFLDAGCGVGGALLCAAARQTGARFVGVERDAAMAALAGMNVSPLGERAEIFAADVFDRSLEIGTFDGVFCNPPYDELSAGQPPVPAKSGARLVERPLHDWVGALADRLRGGGALTLIHRADALGAILAALEGRLGGAAVLPIRPRAEADAHRVIVRAVKGSRAPLRLLPGLTLHDASGRKFTGEAEAVLRDAAPLTWDGAQR
jgi:tRNA1(Val) A37 N6-methylase TrmN6